jgi:Spy/CpxP family protein refolding chaperone
MFRSNDSEFPVFGLAYSIIAIPYNFVIGFLVGVAAPVAAIAAIVAGVRLLTGRVPFLSLNRDTEDGQRRLELELVAADQVEELFQAQKEQISTELGDLQAEIRSIIEEAQADGEAQSDEPEVVEVEVTAEA